MGMEKVQNDDCDLSCGTDQQVGEPTELLLELQKGLEQACWDPVSKRNKLRMTTDQAQRSHHAAELHQQRMCKSILKTCLKVVKGFSLANTTIDLLPTLDSSCTEKRTVNHLVQQPTTPHQANNQTILTFVLAVYP